MARLDREELRRRLEFSERKRTFLQKTLRKRTVEEDTFLWSMADLMTLLLIFFILLYSQTMGKPAKTQDHAPQDQLLLQIEKPSFWRDLTTVKGSFSPPVAKAPQPVCAIEHEELKTREREKEKTVVLNLVLRRG